MDAGVLETRRQLCGVELMTFIKGVQFG
jgi:hypothetical protein